MFLYKICPTSTPDAVGTSSCSESTLLMINGQQWRANIALCEVLESNYTVPQKKRYNTAMDRYSYFKLGMAS